ncbi:MAG: phosphodiester glycosidase family protein, partial [Firmicutes bacterium]|nr:phosphodiester glycosidase family protein [Bacillota bacterium]
IVPIEGWSPDQFASYVSEQGIRDAVAFQDEASDANNHFVPLVINGEARELNGAGSGANPRTVIGQREDGAILLLVTDGRGKSGHLGATASDLISIMLKYGAVNAANLDGGSSSCMYYNGSMLMDSVTLWATNSSWKLPTAFVVMK